MREKIFLIIGGSLFLLLFLIILTSLMSQRIKNNQTSNFFTPSPSQNQINFFQSKKPVSPKPKQILTLSPPSSTTITPSPYRPSKEEVKEILSQVSKKTTTSQESTLITNLIKKLPIDNEFFSAQYLPLLNKIIFTLKNNQSLEKINQFLKENGLEEIAKKYPNLIVITNQKTAKDHLNQEDNFFKTKDIFIKSPPILSDNISDTFLAFLEIYRIFDQISRDLKKIPQNINNSNQPIIRQTPPFNQNLPPNQPPTGENIPSSYNSLDDLINEVASKVGLPAKILKGVIKIEMPSTFNLTSYEVNTYSKPGNTIPNCSPNVCSATGPMQMTTGIDNQGSSTCSSCCNPNRCLNSCPNQWSTYGSAVNIFTGETHQPNPCNLRDNLYAGAYKLKTDSGANNPLTWTKEEVFKAGERYYGDKSCTDNAHLYRYQRLGNRTYCEYLWWYYTQN